MHILSFGSCGFDTLTSDCVSIPYIFLVHRKLHIYILETTCDASLAFELSSDPRNEFLCFCRIVDKHGSTGETRKFIQMRDKVINNNSVMG